MVDRSLIRPPSSRLGPASPAEREQVIAVSFCAGKYEQTNDRVSAYEKLQERAEASAREASEAETSKSDRAYEPPAPKRASGQRGGSRSAAPRRSNRQGIFEAMAKSVVRSIGSTIGRNIARGLLGSFLKGR